MRFLQNGSTDPQFNMAFDEYALERLALDEPVFCLWRNAPSVIIGLNQSPYAEVNLPYLRKKGIILARRVTGGGAVYHDLQNLNYTIVGRSRDLDADYPGYLNMMLEALRKLGVPAELTGRNDILVGGRKCSGYAKRVWKDRLMVHGTLMFDVDIKELTRALAVPGSKLSASGIASVRSKVANLKDWLPGCRDILSLKDALQEILAGGDGELELGPDDISAIEDMAESRFRSWDWIYGKSPAAQFSATRKYPCGTVEASWSVVHGLLENVRFGGDFLGNLPAEELATRLEGLRFERQAIDDALCAARVSEYFDGMDSGSLTDLFFD